MARYIDRAEAIHILLVECLAKYPTSFALGIGAAAKALEDMPTADVEEVRHGEWKDVGEHYCQCSICTTMFEALPTKSSFKADNIFCRHCGAKMEEGDEG